MKKIMFATGNPSKAKRFSKGLKKDDIEVLSLNDLKKKYSCIKSIEAEYTHTERGNYITNLQEGTTVGNLKSKTKGNE